MPKKNPRPPTPGWMWAVFGLGMGPLGAMICAVTLPSHPHEIAPALVAGAFGGLILGLPMLGGLAIASRFFDQAPARFLFGILFGVAITAGIVGVVFAGCMCLLQGSNFH